MSSEYQCSKCFLAGCVESPLCKAVSLDTGYLVNLGLVAEDLLSFQSA